MGMGINLRLRGRSRAKNLATPTSRDLRHISQMNTDEDRLEEETERTYHDPGPDLSGPGAPGLNLRNMIQNII